MANGKIYANGENRPSLKSLGHPHIFLMTPASLLLSCWKNEVTEAEQSDGLDGESSGGSS